MEATKITVQARISADINKVWNYYTRPEHITKWNFASDDWHCPSAENDLRPGGKMKSRMEAKDGSFGFDFEAIYDSIVSPDYISFTMTDGRKAEINFNSDNEETVVKIVFDAENQNPVEMQKDGWQAILNNFKNYSETH